MNTTASNLLIGTSHALRAIRQQIQQVAHTAAPVLIHGEAGAGKTRVAEQIHQESARSSKPFIKIRCVATPAEVLERELFGFEQVDASGRWSVGTGWLVKARGGTIYFDEITALAASIQSKLLRLLEDHVFEPLGSIVPVSADVRILAGTRRTPEQLARSRTFQQNLYYRLTVFPMHMPPLCQHKTDIPALVEHFMAVYSRKHGKEIKGILAPGKAQLTLHRWPGNVRELEECLEQAILASADGWLRMDHHCCPANFWLNAADYSAQDRASPVSAS